MVTHPIDGIVYKGISQHNDEVEKFLQNNLTRFEKVCFKINKRLFGFVSCLNLTKTLNISDDYATTAVYKRSKKIGEVKTRMYRR